MARPGQARIVAASNALFLERNIHSTGTSPGCGGPNLTTLKYRVEIWFFGFKTCGKPTTVTKFAKSSVRDARADRKIFHLPLQCDSRFLVAEFAKNSVRGARVDRKILHLLLPVGSAISSSGICKKFRPRSQDRSEDFASSATVRFAISSSGICKKFRPRSQGRSEDFASSATVGSAISSSGICEKFRPRCHRALGWEPEKPDFHPKYRRRPRLVCSAHCLFSRLRR